MMNQTPRKNQKSLPPQTESFVIHLKELRWRILLYCAGLLGWSLVGYFYHDAILHILIKPLGGPVFYTSPAGAFDFTLKISVFFGFLFSLPALIYHILKFSEPALPKKISGLLIVSLIASSILLIVGMSFAYFISLPAALMFLNKFSDQQMMPLISSTEYFSFVTRYLLGFGIAFQLPLIVLIMNFIKKIQIKKMLEFERWVIVLSFVLAALLTPTPDIFNQLIMAAPLILLYQLTIVAVWLVNKLESTRSLSYPV